MHLVAIHSGALAGMITRIPTTNNNKNKHTNHHTKNKLMMVTMDKLHQKISSMQDRLQHKTTITSSVEAEEVATTNSNNSLKEENSTDK